MEFVVLSIGAALLQYLYFGIETGRARGAGRVMAPSVVGDENFERHFRAHQNTLEQLIVFIPASFACGLFVQGIYVALVGLLFMAGRQLYFSRYVKDPTTRGPGMLMTMVANTVLIMIAMVSAVAALV